MNVAKAKDILVWTTASGYKTNHIAFYAGENTFFHACNKYVLPIRIILKNNWIYQGKT
jgi:cell wall-associated NlpC family hydrolase